MTPTRAKPLPFLRTLRVLGISLAALVVLDTAVWWWLSGRVATLYAAWQAGQITEGHTITTGPVSRIGWPFWPAADLPEVMIATNSAGGQNALAWRTALLRLTYRPWRPSVFTAEAIGPQSLQAGDAPVIPIIAGRLLATIPLDPAQPGGVVVEADAIAALLPPGTVAADRLSLRLRPDDAQLAITTLTIPARAAGGPLPFGGVVNALSLHAHANVPLPEGGSLAASLIAWRRAGGELQLSDIALHWGPLEASGAATLTLDAGLQPSGSGTIRLTGYQEFVDALLRSGAITHVDASIATATLSLLSTGESGKPREVILPFHLQDGIFSAGAVPLLRVPKFIPR